MPTSCTFVYGRKEVLTHSQTAAIITLDVLLQFGEHLNVIPILKFILGSLGAIICLLRESITIASSILANYGPNNPNIAHSSVSILDIELLIWNSLNKFF